MAARLGFADQRDALDQVPLGPEAQDLQVDLLVARRPAQLEVRDERRP
jgi:hypothetical protein